VQIFRLNPSKLAYLDFGQGQFAVYNEMSVK